MSSHVPVKAGLVRAILMSWRRLMLRGLRMPLTVSAYSYAWWLRYKYGRFPYFADLHAHFVPLLSPLFIPNQDTDVL